MTELDKARQIINETDEQMARLFEKRMEAAKAVALYKKQHGLQITDAAREAAVIESGAKRIENEELKSYYLNFLQYNMELSKSYQKRLNDGMRVAYSGVEGAFANIAAKKIFPYAVAVGFKDFKAAYDSVESGECDCAVLPIENSSNGDVAQVMDLTIFGSLFINGVYDIAVVQNLLGIKGSAIEDIKKVISHPQALGQCAAYIERHGFEPLEAVNTAVAVKQVSELARKDTAAIGSEEAAEKYGLTKLDGHINEAGNNTTRFAVFSKTMKAEGPADNHFIMVFTVKNEAGSLSKVVSAIGEFGFNLRALKSRPTKELIWDYYFFVEGNGSLNTENGRKMLEIVGKNCSFMKVAGIFEKEIVL